jgi:hypothetical protein
MTIAEGVSVRVAYKANAAGTMSSNTEADTATVPGASSAQVLRRVSSTLDLTKETYESAEIREDRQIADFRHGIRRVAGAIQGELSPGTYFDFIEATNRDTATAGVVLDETDMTSCVADNATSKFTFGAGDPVALGLGVGMVIRFTNLSVAGNNATNFTILSFGGTSNREVTVTPAPLDNASDTAFTLTVPGKTTIVPATGHVRRLFTFEHYHDDLDIARLFTECRVHGYQMSLPATGMATIEIPVMGRNMQVLTGGSAPYFTSPTAAGTTGIAAAVNGVLLVGGTQVGVVTAVELNAEVAGSGPAVVGQNFVPDIILGRFRLTGQVTALFDSATLLENFLDEDEVALLVRLDASSAANTEAVSIYLPRIKFGGAAVPATGEGEQTVTLPFQALLYGGATAGVPASTIRIHDTAAA